MKTLRVINLKKILYILYILLLDDETVIKLNDGEKS